MNIRHPSTRSGLTLFETVISLAILITALAALIGNIFTLNVGHRANLEVARASDVVQVLVERIQGLNWNELASSSENLSWTWSRRGPITAGDPDPDPVSDPITFGNWVGTAPPMTEEASTASLSTRVHNLLIYDPRTDDSDPTNDSEPVTGFIAEPTGLTNLRIWVEYRQMTAVDGVATRQAWIDALENNANLVDPHNTDPGAAITFDPTTFDRALVIRIVARWDSISGNPRTYEVSFSRRR